MHNRESLNFFGYAPEIYDGAVTYFGLQVCHSISIATSSPGWNTFFNQMKHFTDTIYYNIESSDAWLKDQVFPLWTKNAFDPVTGAFSESLDQKGLAEGAPRRALVQSRQIYAYTEAVKMNILQKDQVSPIIKKNIEFIKNYSLPSGAYLHALDIKNNPVETQSELYTQAFMLFGLARAFEILQDAQIKARALALVRYLTTARNNKSGGFTEIKNNKIVFQSNPHMHLFEAVIEWIKIDSDNIWKEMATDIYQLCRLKFVNNEIGAVAEYFSEDWQVLRENNKFIFEPGHQYEWAWLIVQFEELLSLKSTSLPLKLFDLSEMHGVDPHSNLAFDEILSDFSVNKLSSRFWPQCERIKTAVQLGVLATPELKPRFAKAADEAMAALNTYFKTETPGLWFDTKAGDKFILQSSKASSLYHIINALSEYKLKRPRIN